MLAITFDEAHHAFILSPESRLTKEDISELTEHVNTYINEHDAIPALVINAPKLTGWADFGTFVQHMRFIRGHEALIPKVAVVSDGRALSILPHLANHFVTAQLKHFSEDRIEAAKDWVSNPASPPGKLDWIGGLPRDVVALSASGTITARDYEDTIIPAIHTKLEEHDRLKLLFHLGEDFDGWTAGAAWDDAKLGLLHLTDFSRVALVSDIEWIGRAARLFAPLLRGEVHVFSNDELDAAKTWIKA